MKERPPTPTFEDIVENYRAEMEDPALEPLLQCVRRYSQKIDGMPISARDARKIRDELNNLLDKAGGDREDICVRVSGKARLFNEGDVAQLQTSVLPPHLHGFHLDGNQLDADGVYYPLHRQLLALDYISVDPVGPLVKGQALHRINFHMSARAKDYDELADYEYYAEKVGDNNPVPEDEEEEDYLDVIMYAHDVDTIELHMSSLERIARDLRRDFPAIAAQFDRFSLAGDDSERIRIAGDLALSFDWKGTRYTTVEERQEVLDTIGKLIIEKLHLDTSLYLITHKGLIYAVRHDDSRIAHIDSTPHTTSGIIVGCIFASDGEEINLGNDHIELSVTLLVSAPASGHGRGDHLLMIPASSVVEVANTRNDSFFFESLQEMPAQLESQSMEDIPIAPVEKTDPELTTDTPPNTEHSVYSYDQLLACQEEFAALWEDIRQTCESQVFTDLESAYRRQAEYLDTLAEYIRRHYDAFRGELVVSGECLEYVDVKSAMNVYGENDKVVIDMSQMQTLRGDELVTLRGRLSGTIEVPVVPFKSSEDTIGYKLAPYLLFYDLTTPQDILEHEPEDSVYSTSLFTMETETKFAVALTRQGTLEFSDLVQLKLLYETLSSIEQAEESNDEFVDRLMTLSDAISQASPTEFADIDINDISFIATASASNETLAPLLVRALDAILLHRKLVLNGDVYDARGQVAQYMIDDDESLDLPATRGRCMGVLDEAPNQPGSGPTIVIHNLLANSLHYVPIARLTRLQA